MVNEEKNLGDAVVDRETEQGVKLPPMPDPPPSFDISLKAELTTDFERYSTGYVTMKQHVGEVEIDGKEIGRLGFGYDGSAVVTIGRRTYRVKFAHIFDAIYEADQSK